MSQTPKSFNLSMDDEAEKEKGPLCFETREVTEKSYSTATRKAWLKSPPLSHEANVR